MDYEGKLNTKENRIDKIKERLKENGGQFHKDKIDMDVDCIFLLEQNQRLAEEVERLQNELSGRNKLIESEWNVVVSGAKMIQSIYHKESIGWIKIQRLIDQYTDGDRSDDLKKALNKVE